MPKNRRVLKKSPEAADTPPRLPDDQAEARRHKALSLIQDYTVASLAPATIPFPVFDLIALTGIQLRMVSELSRVYGVEFSKTAGRTAIKSLLSKMLSRSFAPALASLVKIIPGLGQASGIAGMMATSGASTYAVGKLFVRHFEAGGNVANFDAKAMGRYIQQEFATGKKVSRELKHKSGK